MEDIGVGSLQLGWDTSGWVVHVAWEGHQEEAQGGQMDPQAETVGFMGSGIWPGDGDLGAQRNCVGREAPGESGCLGGGDGDGWSLLERMVSRERAEESEKWAHCHRGGGVQGIAQRDRGGWQVGRGCVVPSRGAASRAQLAGGTEEPWGGDRREGSAGGMWAVGGGTRGRAEGDAGFTVFWTEGRRGVVMQQRGGLRGQGASGPGPCDGAPA